MLLQVFNHCKFLKKAKETDDGKTLLHLCEAYNQEDKVKEFVSQINFFGNKALRVKLQIMQHQASPTTQC